MKVLIVLVLFASLSCGVSAQKDPPLASCTHYASGSAYPFGKADSACACNGTRKGAKLLHDWANAATNDYLFGVNSTTANQLNCGEGTGGCMKCFKVTTTGRRSDNPHWTPKPKAGVSINVVVTNFCPARYNPDWCRSPNKHGYKSHFNLDLSVHPDMDPDTNPELKYEHVTCPKTVLDAWFENCCTDPKWKCNGDLGGKFKCPAKPPM
eukprot:TRINITY_DN96376_c0_g1_i1.p1 TRINITY_DN96376_c0_g1~~TRINITY_DN96376_c0_g1_i1.p1  ORF type:complete len:209 (+),score=8.69 TRINITY_DN96376_c0_g1_i1:48-674(+)